MRKALDENDPLRQAIDQLYVYTPRDSFPADPYSDDGLMYRIWNYRHQVTHRGRQPFLFALGPEERAAHLFLDPRDDPDHRIGSERTIAVELHRMQDLVTARCEAALALI